MKNNTKRIFISILTLVLTVVAVGTTTFAWFSLSNVANISNVSGSVQGGEGLEVRIVHDGEGEIKSNFRTNLSDTDWGNFLKAKSIHPDTNPDTAFKFGAVSTDDGFNFNHLTQVTGTSNLTISDLNGGANKQYLEFELEFRSLLGGTINLTNLDFKGSKDGVWSNSGGSSYRQINETDPTNNKVNASPRNAARVAFYNEDKTSLLNAYQETKGKGTNGYEVTDGTINGNNFSTTTPVTYGQWSFLTESKGINIVDSDNQAVNPANILTLDAKDVATVDTNKVEFDLSDDAKQDDYHTARITVRIWIEGWDADAYDTIFNLELNVNMTFAKKEQ